MDLAQRRQQLRQKQVDKVKKFRDSAAETAAYQKKKESEVKTKSKSSGSRLVPKISTKTKFTPFKYMCAIYKKKCIESFIGFKQ